MMDTVESQLTMCCRRGGCTDRAGWRLWNVYTCDDFVHFGVCADGDFTERYHWLDRWAWYYNSPDLNCCACGRNEPTSPAYECGRTQKETCNDLQPVGAAVCISDCYQMWDVACARWTHLHGSQCPACNPSFSVQALAYDYLGMAPADGLSTPPGEAYASGGAGAAVQSVSDNAKELMNNLFGKARDYKADGYAADDQKKLPTEIATPGLTVQVRSAPGGGFNTPPDPTNYS